MPAAFTLATLAGVEEFAARLETRLEARLLLRSSAGSPKQAVQEPLTEEVEHAASLTAAIAAQLALPAHESDPALIQAALHCLACLAAWDNAARRALLKAGAVEQAGRAALPASAGELPLPPGVAHVALMILVNLSVGEEGAERVAPMSDFLQTIADAAEDVRCRSLAKSVLGNVAQHGGLLHQLTTLRAAPGVLQKVNPKSLLATFAQLESGCLDCAPPATPANARLPQPLRPDQAEAAAERAAAAADQAEQHAEQRAAEEERQERQGVHEVAPAANGTPSSSNHAAADDDAATAAAAAAAIAAAAAAATANGGPHAAKVAAAPVEVVAAVAVAALRGCGAALYSATGLQPVARVTSAWGAKQVGVVLSSIGSALHRAPHAAAWRVAAALHCHGAVPSLLAVLSAARAAGDAAARAGAIYCLAAVAHRAGGRMLRAAPPPPANSTASYGAAGADAIETLLDLLSRRVDEGAAGEVVGDRLNALAALQCAAADPLTVRRVARRLEVVQSSLRNEAEAALACAVIANVEGFSFRRWWYARPQANPNPTPTPTLPLPLHLHLHLHLTRYARPQREAALALLAPPPPPPPPLVCYSQAPVAPAGLQPADLSDPARSLALVPRFACQLHPWTPPPVRRAAAAGLASLLLGAWHAGSHDPVLLFLLEASLAARRLAFALPLFAREGGPEAAAALEAALFCLVLLPLLGGGAQLLTPQVLDKLLPLASEGRLGPTPSPASALEAATPAAAAAAAAAANPAAAPLAVQCAALQALQNATSDPRLTASLVGPDGAPTAGEAGEAVHALRDACALPHVALADVAFGAVANLQQLHHAAHCRDAPGGGARRAEVAVPHQRLPPPPPLPAAGAAGRSHRAIPRLCQQLQPWAPRAAQRRAALQLGGVLGSASLDDEAALALLRACDGVPALLRLLRGGAPPPAGVARVLTPPAPADVMEPLLRDACLYGLTLVARLGGAARLLERAASVFWWPLGDSRLGFGLLVAQLGSPFARVTLQAPRSSTPLTPRCASPAARHSSRPSRAHAGTPPPSGSACASGPSMPPH